MFYTYRECSVHRWHFVSNFLGSYLNLFSWFIIFQNNSVSVADGKWKAALTPTRLRQRKVISVIIQCAVLCPDAKDHSCYQEQSHTGKPDTPVSHVLFSGRACDKDLRCWIFLRCNFFSINTRFYLRCAQACISSLRCSSDFNINWVRQSVEPEIKRNGFLFMSSDDYGAGCCDLPPQLA